MHPLSLAFPPLITARRSVRVSFKVILEVIMATSTAAGTGEARKAYQVSGKAEQTL